MNKPLLVDLFCCQQGAQSGYERAGFRTLGVDIQPQPLAPLAFRQADVFEFAETFDWSQAAAVHASPPCQAFTVYGNNRRHVRADHPNLIPRTRDLLRQLGLPYIIENVPGAPLEDPIRLCGTSFGVEVRRHRLFESNIPLEALPCDHGRFTERKYPGSSNRPNGRTVCNVGEYRVPLATQREVMEMPWADLHGLSQAVHPRVAEYLGRQLIAALA